jgi:hypothetical protein
VSEGGRARLAALAVDGRSGVVEAYSDPAIQKWHVRSMTEDEALGWVRSWAERWAAETGASWAILENDTLVADAWLFADGWHDVHLHARVR